MTEEHKQKIREGVAKAKAEREASQSVTAAVPVTAAAPDSLTPRQAFAKWLATNRGKDATDPRLPSDYGRMMTELEDRLFMAFTAGLDQS